MQDNWGCVSFAIAGGVVLSIGNLATQYAWPFVGLSVVEVVTSSITVVIGLPPKHFYVFVFGSFYDWQCSELAGDSLPFECNRHNI